MLSPRQAPIVSTALATSDEEVDVTATSDCRAVSQLNYTMDIEHVHEEPKEDNPPMYTKMASKGDSKSTWATL